MGKNNKSKKGKSAADDDVTATKTEQKLQAVLLADSFVNTFRPLSLDSPKVLCPLNNVTLLDYSMDFLAGAGVEELFVVCVHDAVEEHVSKHLWTAGHAMDVTVVKDSSLTNAGDALRELDKRNLVQSDPFLLMFGDVVTNVNVQKAMQAHKERHAKDSSAMMTLLLHHVGDAQHASLRVASDDLVVGLDPTQENRVVVYDNHSDSATAKIPCSFFANHPQVDLYTDLQDAGVYICSPDVLARFSDEFDYRNIGKQFLANSVAEEEEGLQNRIYAHILADSEYAARVSDFRTYHSVAMDLLQRWCYPVVPDNLPSGYEKSYRYALLTKHNYLYKEAKCLPYTKAGRTSCLEGPGMIGSSCTIGEECSIKSSILGHHIKVEDGVSITNSHIWDNVTIHANVTIDEAIIAQNVIIHEGAVIPRGCVLGQGSVIGKGVVLSEFTRITLKAEEEEEEDDVFGDFSSSEEETDDDDDDEESQNDDVPVKSQAENIKQEQQIPQDGVVTDHAVVGSDGTGHAWEPAADFDDEYADDDGEDENGETIKDRIKEQSLGFELDKYMAKRTDQQAEPEDDGLSQAGSVDEYMDTGLDYGDSDAFTFSGDDGTSAVPVAATSSSDVIVGRQKGVDVVKELKEICMEFEETAPITNLFIEISSYKFSQNASYSDCSMAAMLCILDRMQIAADMTDGKLVTLLKQKIEVWGPLLKKMGVGIPEEKAIIQALEQAATSDSGMGQKLSSGLSLRFFLQTLHDEEVLCEEAILSWAAERKEGSADTPLGKLFQLQAVQDFLEWLEEESEDEDDDSEEESDED